MTTQLSTRRTLARTPVAPPATRPTVVIAQVARPPVAAKFVPPERPHVISTEVWGYVATFGVGAFVGAWLMGLGLWIVH